MAQPFDLQSFYHSPREKEIKQRLDQEKLAQAPVDFLNKVVTIQKSQQDMKRTDQLMELDGIKIKDLQEAVQADTQITGYMESMKSDPEFQKLSPADQVGRAAGALAGKNWKAGLKAFELSAKLNETMAKADKHAGDAAKIETEQNAKFFGILDPKSADISLAAMLASGAMKGEKLTKFAQRWAQMSEQERTLLQKSAIEHFTSAADKNAENREAKMIQQQNQFMLNMGLRMQGLQLQQERLLLAAREAGDGKAAKTIAEDGKNVQRINTILGKRMDDEVLDELNKKVKDARTWKMPGTSGLTPQEEAIKERDAYLHKNYTSRVISVARQLSDKAKRELVIDRPDLGLDKLLLLDSVEQQSKGEDAALDGGRGRQGTIGQPGSNIEKRAKADPTMKGKTFGKVTPKGLEVFENGKLIGHYQ